MSISKICIVTTRSINDSPCLDKYKELIDVPYDIIYWDKNNTQETCGANNYYRYIGIVPAENGKLKKLFHYVAFAHYIRTIIRKNDYEKLIVYPTQMGWLLRGLLKTKYKGKYLYYVMYYVCENNKLMGALTAEAVRNSGMCSITSPAFKAYLPEYAYVISHNVQPIDQEIIDNYKKRVKVNDRVVLSFIGTVRFISQMEKVISVFGNDPRFVLKFIGRGSERLMSFIKDGRYSNVKLIGQFERRDIGKYYLETDMAINVYGNDRPALTYALSNKLYSAALMGMPILASPHTYTAEIVQKYSFGYAVDLDEVGCADAVYDYYMHIDRLRMQAGCETFLKSVNEDEALYASAL